ncbi:MAG TPA: hypothetical protein VG165_05350 [Solirubrobacteraceae bacterium]|nr:hypothetical protein [Solirubrobacteraceae bacterium]
MTDQNFSNSHSPTAASQGETADSPSPWVSAFVAEAIVEQRRIDGLMQLLADMAAVGEGPTGLEPTPARDALGVS